MFNARLAALVAAMIKARTALVTSAEFPVAPVIRAVLAESTRSRVPVAMAERFAATATVCTLSIGCSGAARRRARASGALALGPEPGRAIFARTANCWHCPFHWRFALGGSGLRRTATAAMAAWRPIGRLTRFAASAPGALAAALVALMLALRTPDFNVRCLRDRSHVDRRGLLDAAGFDSSVVCRLVGGFGFARCGSLLLWRVGRRGFVRTFLNRCMHVGSPLDGQARCVLGALFGRLRHDR